MNEDKLSENIQKNSNDLDKKVKFDTSSRKSIEANLISRKKVKIKTLRRLNLDLPDELLQYDNENQNASPKPQSNNQIIESYEELTHRSMFFPKPKKVENDKKNSSTHLDNLKEYKNKFNIDEKNNNDNFSNKDIENNIEKENEINQENKEDYTKEKKSVNKEEIDLNQEEEEVDEEDEEEEKEISKTKKKCK